MKNITVTDPNQKLSTFSDLWSPKIIAELNESYIKLAKLKGEYVWHKHDNEDEMFLIIKGNLTIELRDKTLSLNPGQMVVIPKGVEHRPVASDEVHVMLIEPKTTLSTGDSKNTEDKKATHGEWI
ncbi:MAG TPA: cupin domain-containing protein [Candidatus Babeliales bacterium]|nr:cupin domain-containing protein [Candidatus Babeliales bacterium]